MSSEQLLHPRATTNPLHLRKAGRFFLQQTHSCCSIDTQLSRTFRFHWLWQLQQSDRGWVHSPNECSRWEKVAAQKSKELGHLKSRTPEKGGAAWVSHDRASGKRSQPQGEADVKRGEVPLLPLPPKKVAGVQRVPPAAVAAPAEEKEDPGWTVHNEEHCRPPEGNHGPGFTHDVATTGRPPPNLWYMFDTYATNPTCLLENPRIHRWLSFTASSTNTENLLKIRGDTYFAVFLSKNA